MVSSSDSDEAADGGQEPVPSDNNKILEAQEVEAVAASLIDTNASWRSAEVAPTTDRCMLLRHCARKTIHFGHKTSDVLLACKVPRTSKHIVFTGNPDTAFPKCHWCFPAGHKRL